MMENDSVWEFNCPQYVDFLEDSLENDEGADAFFDTDCKTYALQNYKYQENKENGESECALSSGQSSVCYKTSTKQPLKRSFRRNLWPKLKGNMAQSPLAKKMRFSVADAAKCHPDLNPNSIRNRLRSHRKGFASNEVGRKPIVTSQVDKSKEFDFVATLRQYEQRPEPVTKGVSRITNPSPFKLTEPKTRASLHEYKSMAQAINEFHTRTPARFRTKKQPERRRSQSGDSAVSGFSKAMRSIREACSPNLLTKLRQRPVTCLSREEQERIEAEELKKFQFHAKPVNKAIFERGDIGVHPVQPKPSTIVQPFNLHASNSTTRQDQSDVHEELVTQFHARPVPKGIFERPLGLPEMMPRPPTIPQSPRFLLRERNKENSLMHRYDTRSQCSSLNSTATSQSSLLLRWDPKPTIVKPFTFDSKDIERLEKKKAKIREIYEEEKRMRDFHANPMPNFEACGIPMKKRKSPTKCQPFRIVDEVKPMRSTKEWEQEIQEELQKQRLRASFRASKCMSTRLKPFVPQRSDRILTEPVDFNLQTEVRHHERQKFEACLKEKEELMEERIKQQQQIKQNEEEEMWRNLRAAAVHAAQPVRRYKPVGEAKCLPLTTPMSPCFQLKQRN